MNVNDVVCVGAEPIALLDYLAVERPNPAVMEQIGIGLKRGAELAGVEIPGGEVAILPELIRGHPRPNGFDLTATCFGTVALDADHHRRRDLTRGRADRPAIQRPALELVRARPPRGRGPGAHRRARRPAPRTHRDLRQSGAGAHPQRHPGPRPRPHHRRRPAEPPAAQRRTSASTSRTRSRSRRSSSSSRQRGNVSEARPGRSSTWAVGSWRSFRTSARTGGRTARPPPRGHPPDRHGHERPGRVSAPGVARRPSGLSAAA